MNENNNISPVRAVMENMPAASVNVPSAGTCNLNGYTCKWFIFFTICNLSLIWAVASRPGKSNKNRMIVFFIFTLFELS